METGDPVLDAASREYRRTGNIDVFNNMMMFACDSRTFRECGAPREITGELYAQSPFAAAVKKIGEDIKSDRKKDHP